VLRAVEAAKSRRTVAIPALTVAALEPSGIPKHFKRRLTGAGLPPWRFHDLRHPFACLLLTGNTHPKVVQELLGHTPISTTTDVYSHVTPSLVGETASRRATGFHGYPGAGLHLGYISGRILDWATRLSCRHSAV
jgi:integrase